MAPIGMTTNKLRPGGGHVMWVWDQVLNPDLVASGRPRKQQKLATCITIPTMRG
jgi:hypothetical protein